MSFELQNLSVSINSTAILSGVSLCVKPGTTHILMGPNGSGKSTLVQTIMGNPIFEVISGTALFNGTDIFALSPDKRAKLGIFMAFQQPVEIPGVQVFTFLHEIYKACKKSTISTPDFYQMYEKAAYELEIDPAIGSRNLHEGFSGGQKKNLEMLQLMLLEPQLVLLDELDSGLDVDALKVMVKNIATLRARNPQMAIIAITHYNQLLQYLMPEYVHVLREGRLIATGGIELAQDIELLGYDAI